MFSFVFFDFLQNAKISLAVLYTFCRHVALRLLVCCMHFWIFLFVLRRLLLVVPGTPVGGKEGRVSFVCGVIFVSFLYPLWIWIYLSIGPYYYFCSVHLSAPLFFKLRFSLRTRLYLCLFFFWSFQIWRLFYPSTPSLLFSPFLNFIFVPISSYFLLPSTPCSFVTHFTHCVVLLFSAVAIARCRCASFILRPCFALLAYLCGARVWLSYGRTQNLFPFKVFPK